MAITMKTLFITVAEDIIARNIIFTVFWPEFVQQTADWRKVVIVPEHRLDYYNRVLRNENIVVEPYKRSAPGRFENLIMSLARSGINSKTNLWSKMRSYYRGDSTWLATMIKRALTRILGGQNWYKHLLRRLILTWRSDEQLARLYDHYRPEALVALSLTNFDFDVLIAREARRRKVIIVGMVRSWDNLSSHGLLRVVPDVFLLQNQFLKDMAAAFQGLSESVVPMPVVGLPHYDALKNIEPLIQERAEFLHSLNIDPEKKVVCYGAMGEFLFIHESEMPAVLNSLVEQKKVPADVAVIYRAHPKFMIDPSKAGAYPHVVFDTAGKYVDIENIDIARNENVHLVNLLYHSDVVVTTASTIAIDAAIMDKPVVCTGFDGLTLPDGVRYWESARRFYDHYTHFEAVMETGGVRFAGSPETLAQEINYYLADPKRDHEGRLNIIRRFVDPFDGQSGKRLASLVAQEISKKQS